MNVKDTVGDSSARSEELVNNEVGYLTEEISKCSVEYSLTSPYYLE